MSEEALISTIRVEMEMRKAQGDRVLLVTPGNYGQDFLKTYPWVRADHSVKCSNYVGKTLEFAAELGFDAILFVAHLGKFVKVSGGIMNTPVSYTHLKVIVADTSGNRLNGGAAVDTELFSMNQLSKKWVLMYKKKQNNSMVYTYLYNEVLAAGNTTDPLFTSVTAANICLLYTSRCV